jgi:hypothetical protein
VVARAQKLERMEGIHVKSRAITSEPCVTPAPTADRWRTKLSASRRNAKLFINVGWLVLVVISFLVRKPDK